MDHYQYGGPFYINIKDVADTSTRWIEDSLMVDMAADTNAALFTFDNRFFGTNIPTELVQFQNISEQYIKWFSQYLQKFIAKQFAISGIRTNAGGHKHVHYAFAQCDANEKRK